MMQGVSTQNDDINISLTVHNNWVLNLALTRYNTSTFLGNNTVDLQ